MNRRIFCSVVVLASLVIPVSAADVGSLLAQIKAVGKEGKGNAAAGKAWRELVQQGPDALSEILAGLDDASPIAANWLRSAVDAIAERALSSKKLSAAKLEAFVTDTRHVGASRRLAFEWLVKADETARARLLSGMLNDPGSELRREAVEVRIKAAQALLDAKDETAARAAYQKILEAARDYDQVKLIAERLDKLGVKTNLTAQFGFITRWALVGPFDNAKGVGFRTPYPPERGVDLQAVYESKDGKKIRWLQHVAGAPATASDLKILGLVDLNKVFQQDKDGAAERIREAVVFGYSVVESKEARPVEIRAGSNNAVRIWLNGKEIFFREEYHHGLEIDQHVGKGMLKAGRNEILIKVCQNHQDEVWARQWSFQLRICDAIGGAVPVTVVTDKISATTGGE